MTRDDSSLRFVDLEAGYQLGRPILRGVTLAAEPGRVTLVLGPNGAGKSTLLKVAAGLVRPSSGAILMGERDISLLPAPQHAALGIGLLLQGRSTFPDLTVRENIELGGWSLRHDRSRLRAGVQSAMARYPALQDCLDRPAGALSGGQQRMVEIARLMVSQPRILLVDEPSAGLSPVAAAAVYQELLNLKREGRTILLVDQNVQAALGIADDVYGLRAGRNDLQGDGATLREDPAALVQSWLGV
jgi:branched-chain amino acid transport system ATP-binding protein